MKYIIVTICMLCSTVCFGQKKLFDKYADEDHVTSVYISKSMFQMMMPAVQQTGLKVADMGGKIESMQLLTTSNKDVADKMRKDFSGIISKDHEELMRVKHEKTRATFHIKKKGEMINELLMLADTNEGYTIIQISGNFTLSDIQDITSEVSQKMGGS